MRHKSGFSGHHFSRKVLSLAITLVGFPASRPAMAQVVQPVLSLNNNIGNPIVYDPMSFGRGQVTFNFFVAVSNAPSFDTTLTATLPAGLSFVSTNNGTATVSGNAATGQQVAVSLGQLFGTIFNYAFTAAIGQSPPDGTQLPVSFQLSGHAAGSSALQASNVIAYTVQAGYLPVSVFLSNYSAICHGSVGSTASGFTRFNPVNKTSNDGSGISGEVDDASGASAAARTDEMPVGIPPGGAAKVGEIAGPGSALTIPGIGYRANAQGGVFFVVNLSRGIINGFPTSGNSDCSQSVDVGFSNPNAYPVALILDQRLSMFSAAGNEKATDPISGLKFGFPGDAEGSSNGVATSALFERFLYAPGGNTERIKQEITCFPEAQDTCDSNPPSDTTKPVRGFGFLFSSSGGLLAPAFATPNLTFDLNPVGNEGIAAFGGTNIATDANTGSVSLVRSGYGTASAEAVTILLRGDGNIGNIEAGMPVRLKITSDSPINLVVTDNQGRRVGFQGVSTQPPVPAPPGVPSPQFDMQPTVLAEIFGASYSGINSQPQVITISDPKAGGYQIQATAIGDPTFLVTIESLDINDQKIDQLTQSGTVVPGSSTTLMVNLTDDGRLSIPGAPGADTVPPTTTAKLSPQPNAAGWNNSNVTVSLTATDNAGGSGVKQITYTATGAQAIATSTVNGASAVANVVSEGTTTISFFATDNAGNAENNKQVVVRLDTSAPGIICGAADGLWHAADVSISCVANDGLSGLANPADASFSLSTAVPAGMETATAATGSRTICDVAGNCANAGPIGGNMIDKKPPSITVAAPAGNTYLLNQAVPSSYSCMDGGSGVATCTGTVANGTNFDTASAGAKTFTINSTDKVGNAAPPQTVNYTVAYNICILYDPSRSVQSGSTIPLRLQLCDVNKADVSSSSVLVHATGLVQASTNASEVIQDSGNANPDNDFRFDSGLGPTGGYIFNLSTKGLGTGLYVLSFSAGADPTAHTLSFQVR